MKLASRISRTVAVLLFALACFANEAASQSLVRPDWRTLRNYSFIPSRSTLHVTGGFAGVDWDLAIKGDFGVVTGVEQGFSCMAIGCPPPPLFPFAKFVDVDAIVFEPKAMGPMPMPGWDLENMLNLEGLEGTFHLTNPNHLIFRGVDGQGAPLKIEAIIRGPLIRLTGENNPHCAGCADYFGYKLNAIGYRTPNADSNFDGVVDGADYVMLRKLNGEPSTGSGGLADDGTNYNLWRNQFADAAEFSAFDDASFATIPEPSTALLLLASTIFALFLRRPR
jgi:hypothetical protein